MLRRTKLASALAAVVLAGGVALAPAAHAERVGFNLSIGGPGYGFSVGNAPYWGHRHYYRSGYSAYYPAPVYVAPPVVYAPPQVVYEAPVIYSTPYYVPRVVRRVHYRHW